MQALNMQEKNNKYRKPYYKDHVQSVGERRIEKYLKQNNIFHLTEVRFSDCVNPLTNQVLMFDFFIPKLSLIVEYDGSQHDEYTKKFHGSKKLGKFEKQQVKDKIKNLYAVEHGYRMLRIKYSDWDKLEEILEKEIKLIKKPI